MNILKEECDLLSYKLDFKIKTPLLISNKQLVKNAINISHKVFGRKNTITKK